MTAKLTLTIEENTIKKAKRLSRRKGKSISRMVEEYLNKIAEHEDEKESVVPFLKGLLKDKAPANLNLKEAKGEYLKKKYGL